jgi:hypothetical protein
MDETLKLSYVSATINLPGSITEPLMTKIPYSVGNSVRFEFNRCNVSAHVGTGIFKEVEIHENYLHPLVDLVTRDLKTIEDLLPQLTELYKQRKAPEQLMYENSDPYTVKIFDCTSTPPGRVFPTMLEIKNTRLKLLDSKYHDLVPLVGNLGKDGDKLVHVKGASLGDALEQAIEIYKLAERIREI